MSATDEVVSAARELAALLRDNYMLPNTWPESKRFVAAVEALDGPAAVDGPQSQAGSANAARQTPSADGDTPVVPLPQDEPARRAPLS